MSVIITGPDIDNSQHVGGYFLPYQQDWIHDDSMLRLVRKSVRIGWTYCDAFKNVRKRIRNAKRDYLFTTKDQATAIEYVTTCKQFAEIFNVAKSIISHGEDYYKVPRFDDNGRDTGFTDEVKVGYIKFDNGSRIIAFSSNPNALRAYGGDVGMDEFAFHPAPDALWASAAGRTTWGYDLGVWSSENGDSTLFHQFSLEAEAGKGGWSYRKVTIVDAIEQGLVEKINQVTGGKTTREEFLQRCKDKARLDEIFEQEYMCNPKGGMASIVPWSAIVRCTEDYQIERVHFESKQITDRFGEYIHEKQAQREAQIISYLRQCYPETVARVGRHKLGFDVAASGKGDLASIYIDQAETDILRLRSLFTCRTEDWDFLKAAVRFFMKNCTDIQGSGDETGLGRQICWEMEKEFPGQFVGENFASMKQDMGFALMNQLQASEKRFPKDQPDIAADYFAIRKTNVGKRWVFSEGTNAHNTASHCDIAWSGGLSTRASLRNLATYGGSLC